MSCLVLDTSAIVAYAAGSLDVGEPISEVQASGDPVIVPIVCLVEAARQTSEEMLRILVDHPACEVAPMTVENWSALAAGTRILGRLDLAEALLLATTNEGWVLTGEPGAYGSLGEDSIIGF